MLARLFALAAIFACTSIAWVILGATINARTNETGSRLRGRVESVWGAPQVQFAPRAVDPNVTRAPTGGDLAVNLALEHRKKGLLWYSTYTVTFQGDYDFRNDSTESRLVQFWWPVPGKSAIYDDLQFQVDGETLEPQNHTASMLVTKRVAAGATARLRVSYRSQGLQSWRYRFGDGVTAAPNFHLSVTTNFKNADFADNTLAPTTRQETATGLNLDWAYTNLFSGYEIAVVMPEKAQPGPLAARISYFAPVSLLFFFFLMFIITTLRGIELHPMNYFFLACAFFAFHLLLAYLADHVDLYVSFAVSAAVSVALVVSYLRIVAGARFALRQAALAQIVYLVLFSFAFFFEGYTGLAVTIGSILTLFVVMQMTGRIRWAEKFGPAAPPMPART